MDIVEIARMRKIIDRSPAFVEKVYSAAERAYCDSHAHPEVHYATRFAAKEAVLKALGTGFSEGIGWLDGEVRRTSKGRPYVVLTGRAREVAREQGVREIPLSLSANYGVGKIGYEKIDDSITEMTLTTVTSQGQSVELYLISYRELLPVLSIEENLQKNIQKQIDRILGGK